MPLCFTNTAGSRHALSKTRDVSPIKSKRPGNVVLNRIFQLIGRQPTRNQNSRRAHLPIHLVFFSFILLRSTDRDDRSFFFYFALYLTSPPRALNILVSFDPSIQNVIRLLRRQDTTFQKMDSADNVVLNVDSRTSVEQGFNGQKRRLNINPAKAVMGGITQSTQAVRGGISQSKTKQAVTALCP